MPDTGRSRDVLSRCAAVPPVRVVAIAASGLDVVPVLSQWGLLGPDRTVLDIGCGIGGLDASLAPLCGAVIGIDISPEAVARARARCASFPNVRVLLGSGHDLAGIAGGSIDLVVLIDTLPDLLLSEGQLAERYFPEISRVLTPGGDVVIVNSSHRDDLTADRVDLERLMRPLDLSLAHVIAPSCASRNAPAFHLVKSGSSCARPQ